MSPESVFFKAYNAIYDRCFARSIRPYQTKDLLWIYGKTGFLNGDELTIGFVQGIYLQGQVLALDSRCLGMRYSKLKS